MTRQASASGIPPREMFENNPLPMWVYDLETLAFLAVNDAAVHHYGYSRGEFLAMTIKEIRPPEEVPSLLARTARKLEGYGAAGTWKHRKKDGTIIDVEIITHTITFAGTRAKLVLANDVTERKRLEQSFHTAAREWRKAFDAMNDCIAWIDRNGRIVRCNKALTVLAKKSYQDIIGHHCEEVVYDSLVPAAGCPIKEVMTTHKRAVATLTSGSQTYRISADPLFADDGEFIGAVHIMADITQQERVERGLHDLALQQKAILDNIPDIAWLKDDQSRILAVNEPFGRACGHSPADLVGKTDLDIWPRELAERYRADDADVMRSRTRKVVEEPLADKEGKTSWIETIKTPIIDEQGRIIGTTGIARDITARRRVEEALRRKEHMLSEAQRIAQIGSWEANFATGGVSWSEEMHRIYGTSPATFVPTVESYLHLVHPQDRKAIAGWIRATAAGKRLENLEFRIIRPDGAERWVRGSVEPLLDVAGQPIGAIGTGQDITGKKKIADVLLASEKKFRTLFEAANDAIFILDMHGCFLDVNTVAHERLGYSKEELLSRNVSEFDSPEFAARVPERIEEIRQHGRAVFESAHIRRDGTIMPVEINSVVVDHEGRKVLYSIVRDISERKRTEAELRSSRLLYENTLASLDESVLVADLKTRKILDCNLATERIFGYSREELIGRDTRLLFINDEGYAAFRGKVLSEIADKGHAEFEFPMQRRNGEVFPAEHLLRPLLNNEGDTLGIVSVVRDISTRKRAENAILDQKAFTEHLIQGSSVATFVINDRHEVVLWNRACEELTGVPAPEMIGSAHPGKAFYQETRPVLADLVLDRNPEKLSRLYPISSSSVLVPEGLHAERWIANLNGKNRYIVFDAAPIRDNAGKVVASIETIQDLTSRKLAEEDIAASEDRYRNIFDNANDMIQSVAPDGRFLFVNAAWRRTLGYGESDLRTLLMFDIIHPSCQKSCKAQFAKVMSGEPLDFIEAKFVARNGRVVDVEGSASVRRDDGKIVSAQVIFRDVTERKKLQEELFRISHDWEETFDTLTDMVTVHDADFNIIRANKAAQKILGLPFLEVKSIKCFEYFHGTECPPAGCPSCASLGTGKPSVNEIFEPHLGRYLEIRAIPRMDSNNQVVGLIHVVRDISERKRTEAALERHSRELAALNTASNTLILITDLRGIYQEICDIMISVFDLRMVWLGTVEESAYEVRPVAYAGHEEGYLEAIRIRRDDSPLGLGPTGMAVKTKAIAAMQSADPAFAPWRAEAQKRGYLASMAVPLIDRSQACIGVLNFYSGDPDYFTVDRMKLCQIFANQAAIAIENARLIAGLEEKVDVRTREYESANVELQHLNKELDQRRLEAESASRTKSDFLANMSHELRTPLNAIIGFSDLMVRGMAGPLAETPKGYLGDILASGKHLLSLINDILDLSKVEAGKMDIDPAEFDPAELIDRCLVLFREKALKHRLDLRAEIDGASEPIFGDERKIRQVLYNLISNAVKFTPDGGSVIVRAGTVREDNRDYAEISVTDTGIGISSADRKRLFQPFGQLSHHLTKEHEGTGLGLTLCKSFVEMHGGHIRVESSPGRGSTFTFRIPARYEKGS